MKQWTQPGRRLSVAMVVVLVGATWGCTAAAPTAPTTSATAGRPNASAAAHDPSAPPTSSPSSSPGPAQGGDVPPTQALIADLEGRVAADPSDEGSQRDLGLALIQRIRETADPSLYAPAQVALDLARTLAPDDVLALVGLGALQLGRHEFADALATGQRAVKAFPDYAPAHGVVVDALVELGRYPEAQREVDRMVALSSDLASLARQSYVRELHGDFDGALAAMRAAVASPGAAPENTAYVTALLGALLVYTGDLVAAKAAYDSALELVPNHAPSIAGLARLAVGDGDLAAAAAGFQRASDILPLPEYVIALGEVQERMGDQEAARRTYALARAEIQLFRASGVVVDVDLALFEADHGDPMQALDLARAGYAATPTTRAADALAWALHRLGRNEEASERSREALRLGSHDPVLRYHAGAIEAALGQRDAARRDLRLALATDPGFSAAGAAEARRILVTLGD
jgi:tetratricopeptide (TPR) repeat protein